MKDGIVLKEYLEKQAVSKALLAKELRMSRQNLYQILESEEMEDDTKKKFETYFNESIFTQPKPYTQQRFEAKLKGEKDVPVFVGNTRLGPVKVYSDDPEMQKPVASLPAQLFPGCNHAEKVSGDSMYPMIMNQAYVVGKIIDKQGIIFGEKYGVHTIFGESVVKFIHPGAKDSRIKLVSHNRNIPDQEIPIDDITFIFRVKYILNPA